MSRCFEIIRSQTEADLLFTNRVFQVASLIVDMRL